MSTMVAPVSPAQHADVVADLVRRYRSVPPGTPVRLGKRTSNLFRFGAGSADACRLDTTGLTGVIAVDPVARTAEVQGMTTYEDLVDATLAHGLMPLVVPQLKTITLGGAVAGLGIESTSFRHGLPHESVLEMDILTGSGELVTATPDGEHADLFAAFPNSYGTLGYALRLVIELQPVAPYVKLTHRRFPDAATATAEIERLCAPGAGPDFLDGTVFDPREQYLTIGEFVDAPMPGAQVSDYTGQQIFYRSLRLRPVDHLRVRDYIWRWDTDWFWCSRAFGVQNPLLRPLWPRRYRRSDVYRRLVALDRRFGGSDRIRALTGAPSEEPVVQDVEIPVDRLPDFLEVFHRDVGISPVWLCPLRLRSDRGWPLYPMRPGELYVNVGFWSSVPRRPGQPPDAHNRLIEELVAALGGHKSLYSTVHYDEAEFWEHYNGAAYAAVKGRYDPAGRLPGLFSKVGEAGER
ncbi:FAD-binding oxidoreductase [Pseudonocardia acidicola]|uniref:Delta(24)-sterol reductase n=1 Tax=Pseudonocardia acidicola TaxID=2724939 RepID=A0ABX1S4B5_9PSEU|nr:FAD-binding oxidoreductase [Pseudonocardia acidicola]NMH96415.1 FAD-binding oxidoreductase [Pseudonocardia acidicola]